MTMILIALLSASAAAARLTVDPEGSGDFLELSDALADAQPGDYIALAPGVHSGGVQITSPVHIIGLGESPMDTELSGASIGMDLRASARVENLFISGSTYGVYSYGASLAQGRRLVLQGSSPLYVYLGTVDFENVAFYGGQVRTQSATFSARQLSFVDSTFYASSSANPVDLVGVIGNAFSASCSSSSIPLSLSYALYTTGSLGTCVSQTAVYAGFDTGWTRYTGDPSTDDLSLIAGSDGVDAGPAGCLDVDGSLCDFGHLGGLLGQDADLDGDAIPDAYEVSVGLDSTLANGDADDDGDGLDNLGEYLFGTDPLLRDSDGDGAEDQEELELGFDPLDPSDQAPTAVLTAPDFGVIGELAVLDASGSSDPTNDTLSYSVSVQAAPAASALLGSELAMAGALATFTPDAVGLWTFELQVSDGVNTASVQLVWRARDVGQDIRVPEDFLKLDDAVAVFKARDTIVIGAGDFTMLGSAVDSYRGLRLVGAGMEQTRITLDKELNVKDLELQDLEMVAAGDYVLIVQDGEHLALSRVRLSGSRYGVYAGNLDWVSVEGSDLSGRDRAANLGAGTVVVARTSFLRTVYVSAQRVRMQGVAIEGGGGAFGLNLNQVGVAELSNLTVMQADTGFYSSNVGALRADHVYLQDVGNINCVFGQWSHMMVRGSTGSLSGCDVVHTSSDGAGLDSTGVPLNDSLAWDGGGPFQVDLDGTRRDIGWTGGPHGMRWDPELERPWQDSDGDGLSAMTEWVLGSDPEQADSDGDGVGDRDEVVAGQDPADPSDNVEVLSPRPVRLTGDAHTVSYKLEDPQSDACEMLWQDGLVGPQREIPAAGAPVERLAFEITCGAGGSSGELLVLREEELSVPGDYPSLLEALAAAEDHHRILLGEGVWEVGELSLEGTEVAITGQAETWIAGQVEIVGEATSLVDLGIIGDLRTTAGGLLRVEVHGELTSSKTWMRNVAVHGDLYAASGSAANLSVVGDLEAGFSDLRSSFSSGTFEVLSDTLLSNCQQGLVEQAWIYPSEFPDQAILLPWPGSTLWNEGSQQEALFDLDGSREDVGWSGGPEARDFDLDDDGLPDPYERWAGVSEPTDDEDQDGWDNAEEFAQGTDPLNWDTDGDRLMDSQDPFPLVATGQGLVVNLRSSDVFPEQGDWIEVRADLQDPAGRLGELEWQLLAPPESAQNTRINGEVFQVHIDAVGAWRIQAQVDVDGEPLLAELTVYTQDPVLVPLSTPLDRAIDEARPGQVLLLEGGPREVSGLVIDKDLVIRHEEGANGTLNSDLLSPMLEVTDGARVRLQGITLRAGTELPAVVVRGGTLEMRQARIIGGLHNVSAYSGIVDIQGSLLSLPDDAALQGVDSSFHLAHSNMGFSNDPDDPGLLFDLSASSVTLVASVPQWEGVSWTLCRVQPCTVLAASSALPDEELVFLDSSLQADGSFYGDPGFLRAPNEDLNPASADMRLSSDSPLRDALESTDWDGSPGDVGMYGGLWGDWLDVDNDRDGYTNLEGDCDDGDPEVVPNLLTGECEARTGCSSQGTGSAPLAMILGLLALLLRLSRTGPKAAGAQGREID